MWLFSYCMSVRRFYCFKQNTASDLRISDWSSDVCSTDLVRALAHGRIGAKLSAIAYVVKPMGMETLVYITIDDTEVCARLDPAMAPEAGQPITLMAAMSHMQIGRASCRERVCQYV